MKTELQRKGVQDLSWAIAVTELLIEFKHTESSKARCQSGREDEDTGFENDADGKPVHRKDKSEKAAKDKGKDHERKSKGCYFLRWSA